MEEPTPIAASLDRTVPGTAASPAPPLGRRPPPAFDLAVPVLRAILYLIVYFGIQIAVVLPLRAFGPLLDRRLVPQGRVRQRRTRSF